MQGFRSYVVARKQLAEALYIILCENTTNYAGKTKNRFGLQVWFGRTLFPLLKHLYLGQVYIWFGFWEL